MILAAATVDKPINVDVNVIILMTLETLQLLLQYLILSLIEVRLKMTGFCFLLGTTWVLWRWGQA